MAIQISDAITAQSRSSGGVFSVDSFDLRQLGNRASPVFVLDDFRVSSSVFGPHPHAGFSAVTYVFDDSRGSLRSRDSLGNDVVVDPGGIVWTQAGRGALHEELPAQNGRELHGLQFFVDLSAKNKLVEPRVLWLERSQVPEWHGSKGDRVRVVVGEYGGVSSPLEPNEPFTLLDADLEGDLAFDLHDGHNALVYVVSGGVTVAIGGREGRVSEGTVAALSGEGHVQFVACGRSRVLILSGLEIRDPMISNGQFVMNDQTQLDEAVVRYRSGGMGVLARAR